MPGLTRQEIEAYEACTCLVKVELEHLFDKFAALVAEGESTVKVRQLIAQEELRCNPFRHRLCQIFSSELPTLKDGSPNSKWGDLTFDEFVDLYNCLSPRASRDVKVQTAFRLYDFDSNGHLGPEDLEQLLLTLATPPKHTREPCPLERRDVKAICERVMRDCDVDGNGRLSFAEFEKLISRVPDFARKFSIITTFTEISDGSAANDDDDPAFDMSAAASALASLGKSARSLAGGALAGAIARPEDDVGPLPGSGIFADAVTVGGSRSRGGFPKALGKTYDSPEWNDYLKMVYTQEKEESADRFAPDPNAPKERTNRKTRRVLILLVAIVLLVLIAVIVVSVLVLGQNRRRLQEVVVNAPQKVFLDGPKDEM